MAAWRPISKVGRIFNLNKITKLNNKGFSTESSPFHKYESNYSYTKAQLLDTYGVVVTTVLRVTAYAYLFDLFMKQYTSKGMLKQAMEAEEMSRILKPILKEKMIGQDDSA